MRFSIKFLAGLFLVLSPFAIPKAEALPLTFHFTGTVTQVTGNAIPAGTPGLSDIISGFYTVDPSTGVLPFPLSQEKWEPLFGFNVAGFTIGGIAHSGAYQNRSFSFPNSDTFIVSEDGYSADGNLYYNMYLDFYGLSFPQFSLPSADELNGASSAYFGFQILQSQHLSLDPVALDLFGTISRVSAVPEPPTLILFGSALAYLVLFSRRRKSA